MFLKGVLSKRYSIQMKFLIIAALLAIIPVTILGLISYLIADYNIQQSTVESNKETIVQIQRRIDEKLIQLNKLILQQTFNSVYDEFLSVQNPENDFVKYNNVWESLYSMHLLTDDIDSVYLLFENRKWIISTGASGRGLSNDINILDKNIRDNISKMDKYYFWMERKNPNGSFEISLVRRIPFLASDPKGYLIVDINAKAFFNIFTDVKFGQKGQLLIITPSGNLFSDGNEMNQENNPIYLSIEDKIKNADGKEKKFTQTVNGKKMVISYILSPYNNWKYVVLIPLEEINFRSSAIGHVTLGICVILIVIGFITALFLSNRFGHILQGVMDIIRKKNCQDLQQIKNSDEFGIIGNYLESLHKRNDMLESEVRKSKPVLKITFLQKLLTEQLREDEIEERFKYYDIPLSSSGYFTVLCIEVGNLRGQSEEDINLFLFAVENVSKEIADNYGNGIVVKNLNNNIVLFFNHEREEVNMQTRAFHIAEEIRDSIEKVLKITTTIGIGNCYKGVAKLISSYREAFEALQYQLVEGSGTVIFIGHVNPEVNSYCYPIKKEQLIVTNIKMGNLNQVIDLVDEFAMALKNKHISYEHLQQSFFQLVASSFRAIYEIIPENKTSLFSYNVYSKLAEMRTQDQIITWLKLEIYPVIIEFILNRRDDRNHKLINIALAFIHEHYHEDLSQFLVAEQVSIPASHFGKIFKTEVGMTFTDYIISYRMEKAKELLLSTEMKISDIAVYLRYINSQNLIRMFKQFTGITPSEFRTKYAKGNKT